MKFEQRSCDKDYVCALYCTAHSKISPGQIVRVFKSIMVRELFRRRPGLKRALWGGVLAMAVMCSCRGKS